MKTLYDDLVSQFQQLPDEAHELFSDDPDSVLEFIKSDQYLDYIFTDSLIIDILSTDKSGRFRNWAFRLYS
jgi:hypothetical protein